MRYIVLFAVLLLSSPINAQNIKLRVEKGLKDTDFNIFDSFYDSEINEVFRIISLDQNGYAIMKEDGTILRFDGGFQHFFDYYNGKVLSYSYSRETEYMVTLKQYIIKSDKLVLVNEIKTGYYGFPAIRNQATGELIITDSWELFGRNIDIYTEDLKLLKSNEVNGKSGYSEVYLSYHSPYVFFAAEYDSSFKSGHIDSKTKTAEIDYEIIPTKLQRIISHPNGNLFFISGNVYSYNNDGKILWSKSTPIGRPYTNLCLHQESKILFIFGKDNILYAFNTENGETLWEKPISDFYHKEYKKNGTERFPFVDIVGFVTINKEQIGMITYTCTGIEYPKNFKENGQLIIINTKGELFETLPLPDNIHIDFHESNNLFWIATNNKLKVYDK